MPFSRAQTKGRVDVHRGQLAGALEQSRRANAACSISEQLWPPGLAELLVQLAQKLILRDRPSSPSPAAEKPLRAPKALRCGGLISDRSTVPEAGSHLPVRWEMERSCKRRSVLDCFNRTSDRRGKAPAFVVCSGSQPRATRRLAGGLTPCEGHIEVFHGDRWQALCDEPGQRAERTRTARCPGDAARAARRVALAGGEVASPIKRAHRAARLRLVDGNFSCSGFVELYRQGLWGAVAADAGAWPELEPPAMGIACAARNLHLCPAGRGGLRTCSRTSVVCQDSKPPAAGLGAGTIVSIFLALVLFGILLLLCGPPAYKRLMKKISKKKQRQWIGPTGFNQNVSFHRTSTVNLRPWAEGPRAQGEDNDYAQPPKKNPYLSAYPALEGASRSSNPPDNSSDSDYDLHSARRV
nr:PREDICTED: T-cell surface glycoprotein CD5 [Apteryx mantelli mantelli]